MATSLSQLRSQHPQLVYRSAQWQLTAEGLQLSFHFHLAPDIDFRPSIVIHGVLEENLEFIDPTTLDWLTFHIGLVEMLSYWKATASPGIVIEAGSLSQNQLTWWHDVLINGMGEYFFVNQIDFTVTDFVKLITGSQQNEDKLLPFPPTRSQPRPWQTHTAKVLIPLGGGKDSVVSAALFQEYLKEHHLPLTHTNALLINPTLAAQQLATQLGYVQPIVVQRHLDPQLLALNQQGYLNGHTPFSALVSFISVLAAQVSGYDFVAVSNERSSNEGNVVFHGHEINHQYSKTLFYERRFQQYIDEYAPQAQTTPLPRYFSLMRPLYELQIAQVFARTVELQPSLLTTFRSCNRGQKNNVWCGECPKCLFAYAILFPFLTTQLHEVFGRDLFAKIELLPIARELLGVAEKKPLECVGTHEENLAAFYLSAQWYHQQQQTLPALLATIEREILAQQKDLNSRAEAVLQSWTDDHEIPTTLANWLKTNTL